MDETAQSAAEAPSESYEAHAVLINLKRKQQDSAAAMLKIARERGRRTPSCATPRPSSARPPRPAPRSWPTTWPCSPSRSRRCSPPACDRTPSDERPLPDRRGRSRYARPLRPVVADDAIAGSRYRSPMTTARVIRSRRPAPRRRGGHTQRPARPAAPCGHRRPAGVGRARAAWSRRQATASSATTLRGFGQTTTEEVEYSNRADLVAVIDAIGVDRAALVGNSRRRPDRHRHRHRNPGPGRRPRGRRCRSGRVRGRSRRPEELALFERWRSARVGGRARSGAIADLDVRVWVDGLGQPETRVPATIRDKVRAMDAGKYAPTTSAADPIPLDPAGR